MRRCARRRPLVAQEPRWSSRWSSPMCRVGDEHAIAPESEGPVHVSFELRRDARTISECPRWIGDSDRTTEGSRKSSTASGRDRGSRLGQWRQPVGVVPSTHEVPGASSHHRTRRVTRRKVSHACAARKCSWRIRLAPTAAQAAPSNPARPVSERDEEDGRRPGEPAPRPSTGRRSHSRPASP